jgi:hypothetical protein
MKKTGNHPVDPAEKNNHAANFDRALRKALDQWSEGDPTEVYVVFTATISKNPGGIKDYRATITTDAPTGPPA